MKITKEGLNICIEREDSFSINSIIEKARVSV
jgi:hypothetical protein